MATNNPIHLNDRFGAGRDVRTGRPGILGNLFTTPPGVADDFWKRKLNSGDTFGRRLNANGQNNYTQRELDNIKFRKAYMLLLEALSQANPQGNEKQRNLHTTRAHLPAAFFAWVIYFGYEIDRTTWAYRPVV